MMATTKTFNRNDLIVGWDDGDHWSLTENVFIVGWDNGYYLTFSSNITVVSGKQWLANRLSKKLK